MIPDIDNSALQITVLGSNSTANLPVQVDVYMPQIGTQVHTLLGLKLYFQKVRWRLRCKGGVYEFS